MFHHLCAHLFVGYNACGVFVLGADGTYSTCLTSKGQYFLLSPPLKGRDARGIVSAGLRLCRLEEIGATMAIRLALSDRTLAEEAVCQIAWLRAYGLDSGMMEGLGRASTWPYVICIQFVVSM
jgi:hypothetical protein